MGWLWMLGGLLIGLFVAFLVYLQQQQAAIRAAANPAAVKAAPQEADPTMSYDFYTMLPGMEIVVPEEELKRPVGPRASDGTPIIYYLQVGSYRNPEEAEQRMAELILMNFSPTVQSGVTSDQRTVHRLRIGPFRDRLTLDRARRRLQDNNINPMVISVRDTG
jgi:cell division protein FtsN